MRASLVASSLLLFRRPASDDRRPGAEIQSPEIDMWRSAAAGQWSVVYTAEGLPGDVRVELAEARAALRAEGAAGFLADAPVGAELWAAWMRELRDAAPSQAGEGWAMRVGVPPGELPALLREVDSWPAPHRLSETSLMADIAAGLLFLRNLPGPRAAESLRQAAQARGGYTVTLGAQSKGWGHAPQSIELMRALKRRWDPAGILNPGAFLV